MHSEKEDMASLDMDLSDAPDHLSGAEEFHAEPTIPNIWTIEPDSHKDDDHNHDDQTTTTHGLAESAEERKMDEPSFLKRLRNKRRNKSDETDVNG